VLPDLDLVCVTLPTTDESFRDRVRIALLHAGPLAHRSGEGLATVIGELRAFDPDADVEAVMLTDPSDGAPLQVWWYVHRDGRPGHIM